MKRGPRGNLLPLKKRKNKLWVAARLHKGFKYRVRHVNKVEYLQSLGRGKRVIPFAGNVYRIGCQVILVYPEDRYDSRNWKAMGDISKRLLGAEIPAKIGELAKIFEIKHYKPTKATQMTDGLQRAIYRYVSASMGIDPGMLGMPFKDCPNCQWHHDQKAFRAKVGPGHPDHGNHCWMFRDDPDSDRCGQFKPISLEKVPEMLEKMPGELKAGETGTVLG